MKAHITKGGAREILGIPFWAHVDAKGKGHVTLDDPAFGNFQIVPTHDSEKNIVALCSSVPIGTKVSLTGRMREEFNGKYRLFSEDGTVPGTGFQQGVKCGTMSEATTKKMFDSLFTSPVVSVPSGVFVSDALQNSIRARIVVDAPRDLGISADKAAWWADLIVHLMHEPTV